MPEIVESKLQNSNVRVCGTIREQRLSRLNGNDLEMCNASLEAQMGSWA